MKYAITTLILMALVSTAGCSSAPRSLSEAQPDRIISRIDDLGSRPDWVRESEPFQIKDGNVVSLGSTMIPGDERPGAAFRVSDNNAKGAIASAIESRLDFVFQNAEEGASLEATQARYIGAEASRLVTSSIREGNRYWEKVATTTDTGERVTRYRVFSTVTMPEEDFKRAILDAVRRAQGKGGLSADFAERVNQHWDKFVAADSATAKTGTAPASAPGAESH